jgi:uncharacterized protein YndB with AHSA1/START domain
MAEAVAGAPIVELRRVLNAPPERVFAAWTNPAALAAWMSPVGHAEAIADVRVGGRFSVVMIGQDRRIEHVGEYLEVSPPSRLVFTWQSPYTGPEPTRVTVALTRRGAGTELVLTHEHLPPEGVASHAGGWGEMLDRLGAHLEATTP